MPSDADRPAPPEGLAGEALLEWHRVCDELQADGRLDKADRAILVLYCQTWHEYQEATHGVRQHGLVIRYSNKMVAPSPYFKIRKETGALLQKLLGDLGLTPAARNRMKAPPEPEEEEPLV